MWVWAQTHCTCCLQNSLQHSRNRIYYIWHKNLQIVLLQCLNTDILLPRVTPVGETVTVWLLDLACRHEHHLVGGTARFLQPKWKHLIILRVSPPTASPINILLLYTSLPPRGSSNRAVSVTFDYGLEGKDQQHNSLISTRWLRSSKGLLCLGACSSDWPGTQTDQRPPEHGGAAALTVHGF